MPSSPYLDENYYDCITQEHFCAECEALVEKRGVVVKDHVLGIWKHIGSIQYPGRKALDEQGRTKEHEWERPPRSVQVLIPIQTHLRFCVECFPFDDIEPDLCNGCDDELLAEHDVTHGEFLWKWTNGYNGPFKQGKIHLRCLPPHFDQLHNYIKDKLDS